MSGFKLSWGGAWRNPANIRLARNGGWYAPSNIFVKSNGQWVKVWPVNVALAMTLSTDYVYGYEAFPTTIYTNNIVAYPVGGTGNYTYTWSRLYGSTVIYRSAGTSSVNFYSTFTGNGSRESTWRCTVSDGVNSVYRDFTVHIDCGVLS